MNMKQTQPSTDILTDENTWRRQEIVRLLTSAYWMEVETVMNYLASAANPEGVRAREITETLAADVETELGHAKRLAARIKELYGTVPTSMNMKPSQRFLVPPDRPANLAPVIRGVIQAETEAITLYTRIITTCDHIDWVTQDLMINLLRDEERHLRQFQGFLREYDDDVPSKSVTPAAPA